MSKSCAGLLSELAKCVLNSDCHKVVRHAGSRVSVGGAARPAGAVFVGVPSVGDGSGGARLPFPALPPTRPLPATPRPPALLSPLTTLPLSSSSPREGRGQVCERVRRVPHPLRRVRGRPDELPHLQAGPAGYALSHQRQQGLLTEAIPGAMLPGKGRDGVVPGSFQPPPLPRRGSPGMGVDRPRLAPI